MKRWLIAVCGVLFVSVVLNVLQFVRGQRVVHDFQISHGPGAFVFLCDRATGETYRSVLGIKWERVAGPPSSPGEAK